MIVSGMTVTVSVPVVGIHSLNPRIVEQAPDRSRLPPDFVKFNVC